MNLEKAMEFVEMNGTEIEREKLKLILGERIRKEKVLKYFENLLNPDGGFPYNLVKGNLSCVSETNVQLGLILEFSLKETDIFKKTLEFLLKIQREDGSWDESPEILRYNPPPWDTPGELKNKMWITAEVTNLLIEASYKNSFEVKKACDFLISDRDEDGKFFGYKITTWISIPIFKNLEREDIFENSLKLAREWIDEENDAAFINWYLECLLAAKISKKDLLFKKCLKKLAEFQKENGSWSSVDGERYTVSITLNALKFLVLSKK